jgi:hypothetical protein
VTSRFSNHACHFAFSALITLGVIAITPAGARAQSGTIAGCGGPMCTVATVNNDTQYFTVGANNTVTGSRTVMVSVRHADHATSCAKIKEVVVRAPRDGVVRDIGSATLPGSGVCNFGPDVVSIPVTPFSDTEIAACNGRIDRKLHVVLRDDNLVGTLVDDTDNGAGDYVNVTAVVNCMRGATNAQASEPVTMHVSSVQISANPAIYTGACPVTVTFTASYMSNIAGPLSTIWTFADASGAQSTTQARAGYNTVMFEETVSKSRNTTVKVTLNANGGQMTSPPAAFRVDCR